MFIERIKELNPEILRAIVAKGLSDEKALEQFNNLEFIERYNTFIEEAQQKFSGLQKDFDTLAASFDPDWKYYGSLAPLKGEQILEMADYFLPLVPQWTEFLAQCQQRLKHYKLHKQYREKDTEQLSLMLCNEYEEFLAACTKAVSTLKSRLVYSALARLKLAASENDMQQEDVWTEMQKKVALYIPREPALSSTFERFLSYHAIVLRYGDATAKKELMSMPWFSKEKAPAVTYMRVAHQVRFILQQHEGLIPLKKPWAIYRGARIRYDLYHNDPLLLARIKGALMNPIPQEESGVNFTQSFADIQLVQDQVIAQHSQVAKLQEGLYFWQGKTKQFLKDYQTAMHVTLIQLIERKVNFVSEALTSLQKSKKTLSAQDIHQFQAVLKMLPVEIDAIKQLLLNHHKNHSKQSDLTQPQLFDTLLRRIQGQQCILEHLLKAPEESVAEKEKILDHSMLPKPLKNDIQRLITGVWAFESGQDLEGDIGKLTWNFEVNTRKYRPENGQKYSSEKEKESVQGLYSILATYLDTWSRSQKLPTPILLKVTGYQEHLLSKLHRKLPPEIAQEMLAIIEARKASVPLQAASSESKRLPGGEQWVQDSEQCILTSQCHLLLETLNEFIKAENPVTHAAMQRSAPADTPARLAALWGNFSVTKVGKVGHKSEQSIASTQARDSAVTCAS